MSTKKIISLALSVCMVSTVAMAAMVTADAADSNVTVSVVDTNAKAGEEITIAVNAEIPDPGVAGFEFAITYDASFMEITAVKEGKLLNNGASDAELGANNELGDTMISGSSYSCLDYYVNADGTVAVMWSTGLDDQKYFAKGSGELITITAKVKDGATGSSEVGIKPIRANGAVKFGYVDFTAGSEVAYTATVNAGKVTIGTAEETTTTTETEKPEDTSSSSSSSSTVGGTVKGDANCDGTVDVKDIALIAQYIVKLKDISEEGLANANVVGTDASVDIKDLSQIKRFLIKDITTL